MSREIDEMWAAEAFESYRRSEQVAQLLAGAEVAVRSPDDRVEVLVRTDGTIRRVRLAPGAGEEELARSLDATVGAAAEAARWARRRLHADLMSHHLP